ncbi:MAG TPA: SurA N-terminal domain-containing protein [Blastocatellia bacterium]|nr:SurA N-terminal domain-containing protein [Blastocatellia bacterium]
MLKFLSKRKRSRKWLLIAFVGLLALGLIGAFTPAWEGIKGATTPDEKSIGEVAGHKITMRELRQALNFYGQQVSAGRGSINQGDTTQTYMLYGQKVLDDLVSQKVKLYEAERLNLSASDREVEERIKQMFNPWPGAQQYRERLAAAGTTPTQFEQNLRESIAEQKLRSFISAAAQVSPQEVEEEYRQNKTSYVVRWVDVAPTAFRDKVPVTEPELRAFFDQRRQDFRVETEQRRARYIFVDQTRAGAALQVTDDELRQGFNPERGVKEVRVSQIVLNIPQAADPTAPKMPTSQKPTRTKEEVSALAASLNERTKGTGGKPAEDFAALARQYSDDSASKLNGGDIGWVNKDALKPNNPLLNVFSMAKDEVSQPIASEKNDKVYIYKVTDRRLPTFEQSREQLLKEARVSKGYTRAVQISGEAAQKLKESKNLDAVLAEINSKHGNQIASIIETPYFTPNDSLANLGAASEFQQAVFALQAVGDVTDQINVNNGLAVAQLVDKREPHDATFEEARTKVEDSYRTEKAKEIAAERARQLAAAASPEALSSLATSMGLKPDERSGWSPGNDPQLGPLTSEADLGRVEKLNKGEITREPIKVSGSDSYVVAAVLDRSNPDMGEAFQKEKKSIYERLLDAKRNTIYMSYMAAVQKRLKDEGDIEIYNDVLASEFGTATPPGSFPMPGGGMIPGMPTNNPRSRTLPVSPR